MQKPKKCISKGNPNYAQLLRYVNEAARSLIEKIAGKELSSEETAKRSLLNSLGFISDFYTNPNSEGTLVIVVNAKGVPFHFLCHLDTEILDMANKLASYHRQKPVYAPSLEDLGKDGYVVVTAQKKKISPAIYYSAPTPEQFAFIGALNQVLPWDEYKLPEGNKIEPPVIIPALTTPIIEEGGKESAGEYDSPSPLTLGRKGPQK